MDVKNQTEIFPIDITALGLRRLDQTQKFRIGFWLRKIK